MGGFPKIGGTFLGSPFGVPIVRTIVFWGLCWGLFVLETTIWGIPTFRGGLLRGWGFFRVRTTVFGAFSFNGGLDGI